MNTIANNIKYLRESKGLSQKDMAELLGFSHQQIAYYESGKREVPMNALSKIALFFGLREIDFYEDNITLKETLIAPPYPANSTTKDIDSITSFNKIIFNHIKIDNAQKN